jgi:tetratricopeptide (TPR) repeat protein
MVSDGPAGPSPIAADAEVGLAFERAGRPDSAIVEYEHYVNTSDPDRSFGDGLKLAWVLDHLARLYEARGNRKDARAAYDRLVHLWKDADQLRSLSAMSGYAAELRVRSERHHLHLTETNDANADSRSGRASWRGPAHWL